MLVKNNTLLLSVNNPAPVLEALPQAKLLNYKGHDIVAVKHTLHTAKVLNNLGLNAPSPILHGDYTFPGRFKPFDNQYKTAEFLSLWNRAYCFNEMRTGKTGSALWASEYLLSIGEIKKVLVVCPLGVIDVWTKAAFDTITHRSFTELLGTAKKRLELAQEDTSYHIINFDGLRSLYHEEYYEKTKRIKRRWHDLEGMYDLVIVDEADAYCNATNWRWKALRQLIKPETKLWLLTGTPNPNAPTDAYGLVKLMHPEKVPSSFSLFEEQLMRPVGPYKKVPREGAVEYVQSLMQPAIRFKRDKSKFPTTFNDRHCEMTDQQKRVFEDVKSKMRHEDEEVEITAANAAVKLVKLQQIMCGAVKDDTGNIVNLNPVKRLKELEALVRQANAKTVIFVPFIASMHMVSNYFTSKKITNEILNGEVSKAERQRIVRSFTHSIDPQLVIAHPKVAAQGQDFTVADTFIWYAPTFSTLLYEQANARGEGPNKSLGIGIYHLGCHPVEWRIYDVLKGKVDMQSKLLELYNSVVYS